MGVESPGDLPDPLIEDYSMERDDNNVDRGKKQRAELTATSLAKKVVTDDLSTASIETIYIHHSVAIIDRTYGADDQGPYIVHVSRIEPDLGAGLSLRPVKVGSVLVHNKVNNIVRDGIKSVGRNRVANISWGDVYQPTDKGVLLVWLLPVKLFA